MRMGADAQEEERARAEEALLDRLITLSPQTMRAIREEARQGVADGIKEGVAAVLTPENAKLFWLAAFAALHEGATKKTGSFVLNGLRVALGRIAWVLFLALGLWMAFGWHGLVAAWKALRSGA
jgi:hypothetical protein